ncbi:hypothetical protein ACFLVX_03675 [Chloroflexota bacterium]
MGTALSQGQKYDIEQLLPYARYAIGKKRGWGTKVGGYDIKPGERVLMIVENKTDPLVIEVFTRAMEEVGARVDLIIHDKGGTSREWKAEDEVLVDTEREYCWSAPLWVFEAAKEYDVVLNSSAGPHPPLPGRYYIFWWTTAEQLSSQALMFPDEVWNLINIRTQEMIRKARKVRVTDLEGTDITFTMFDEYWQEEYWGKWGKEGLPFSGLGGDLPGIKIPYMPGHIMSFPFIPIPQSDAEGVIAGTSNHVSVFPRIEITIGRGKITEMKGGGKYGEAWRDWLERMKDVDYPGRLPGTGIGWLSGLPIGTNPKIRRVRKDLFTRSYYMFESMRAGVIHCDFGPHAHVDKPEILYKHAREGKVLRHIHVQIYFVTYDIETKDGEKIRLIDKGHLTALDDPQVREVAAKYADPDELLKIDWVPPIPGISVPGGYEDYAKDPLLWIRNTPIFEGSTPR